MPRWGPSKRTPDLGGAGGLWAIRLEHHESEVLAASACRCPAGSWAAGLALTQTFGLNISMCECQACVQVVTGAPGKGGELVWRVRRGDECEKRRWPELILEELCVGHHLEAGELVRSQMQEGRAAWVWPWERWVERVSGRKVAAPGLVTRTDMCLDSATG